MDSILSLLELRLYVMPAGVRRVVRTHITDSNRNTKEHLLQVNSKSTHSHSKVRAYLCAVNWAFSQRPLNGEVFVCVSALSTENGQVQKPDFLRATMLFPF